MMDEEWRATWLNIGLLVRNVIGFHDLAENEDSLTEA